MPSVYECDNITGFYNETTTEENSDFPVISIILMTMICTALFAFLVFILNLGYKFLKRKREEREKRKKQIKKDNKIELVDVV